MPGNPKGDRAERNLASLLDGSGYAVLRAPASGSATERSLPDLFAGRGGVLHAMEVKRSSDKPIYLTGDELSALEYFADHFDATPLIGVKFDVKHGDPPWGVDADPGWRFFESDDDALHRTDGGNTRVKREEGYANGRTFVDVFSPKLVADGGRLVEPQRCPWCYAGIATELLASPDGKSAILVCPNCADQIEAKYE